MRYDQLTVLVVDDSRHSRVLLIEILRALGVTAILEASDGSEGLKQASVAALDLVITDLSMRPMDGLDFVKLLRRSPDTPNQSVPVIMITGQATAARVNDARDAGVSEFLAKPFNARDVVRRLHQAIERPRAFVAREEFAGPDRRRRDGHPASAPERRAGVRR
jgi:two-component system, chemotaxis family, chemotaxis protein CheY